MLSVAVCAKAVQLLALPMLPISCVHVCKPCNLTSGSMLCRRSIHCYAGEYACSKLAHE